ncbi:hypothetical protein [Clostridium uliginosum]|uniref:Uncharacterized protein n=1 Tax=Clostridium uliginosum TaxID=119641 RepID=A0A1I1IVC3_9CLOT|nr:hypothetical protein [Clostridium uliginosum]SFC40196.1 hypothetical protein SAMN05421842_10389 [Clostridium uliginosum]
MKKSLLNKLCAVSILACTLLTASPVAANTYFQKELTTPSQTDELVLGNGTRYFYGEASYKKGKAKAYKVVAWAPDPQVGSTLSLVFDNGQETTNFTAKKTDSDGEYQKYYGKWIPSSKNASAYLSFSD